MCMLCCCQATRNLHCCQMLPDADWASAAPSTRYGTPSISIVTPVLKSLTFIVPALVTTKAPRLTIGACTTQHPRAGPWPESPVKHNLQAAEAYTCRAVQHKWITLCSSLIPAHLAGMLEWCWSHCCPAAATAAAGQPARKATRHDLRHQYQTIRPTLAFELSRTVG